MESALRLPFEAEVEFGNVGFEEKNLLEQRRSNNELNPHNFMAYYHADCLDWIVEYVFVDQYLTEAIPTLSSYDSL